MRLSTRASALIALPCLLLQTACGTLIGTQKPVARKAHDYRVIDLAGEGSDWKRLPSARSETEDESQDVSDLAYQSRSMAGIISLNSVCRKKNADPSFELREISRQLFIGIEQSGKLTERELVLDGRKALETTLEGYLSSAGKREAMKLRAVVLREGDCVYDLMYVARPDRFASKEADFQRFVDSFRLD